MTWPGSPRRRPTQLHLLLALLATLVLGGCGPTLDELAVAGIVPAPLTYFVGVLGVWVIHRLWRDRVGEVQPDWAAVLTVGSVFIALALVAAASPDLDLELVAPEAMFQSATAFALALMIGRLRLGRNDPAKAPVIIAAILAGLIALPFVIGWLGEGPFEEPLIVGGGMLVLVLGIFAAPAVVLGVVIETWWARSRWRAAGLDHAADDDDDPDGWHAES